jgi:chemotaxis family two-component system response regulator Rcp1
MPTGIQLGRPIEILLVEDSATDTELTVQAMCTNGLPNNLRRVEDGEAALAYLRREGIYARAMRPDVTLLDLNLPKKDGREVLAAIRADAQLKPLLVVVLTASQDERDMLIAYGLNANSYIVKPLDFQQFVDMIRIVKQYLFTVVTLPPNVA